MANEIIPSDPLSFGQWIWVWCIVVLAVFGLRAFGAWLATIFMWPYGFWWLPGFFLARLPGRRRRR